VEDGDVVGAAEDCGALDEDVGAEEVGEEEEGPFEELEEVGAAALRLADDIKDRGPELNRIAERERIITIDKIRDRLLIVTFVSLLSSLRFFLSLPSAFPVKY
jgi:hypothetical protein